MGHAEETLPLPPTVATVAQLIAWLRARNPAGAHTFDPAAPIRAAVNQTFATPETTLTDQDEVAFFPPVTGG